MANPIGNNNKTYHTDIAAWRPFHQDFRVAEHADAVGEWWRALPGLQRAEFLEQGQDLASLVFRGDWCRRRVVNIHFIEERRGEWHLTIDFTVPAITSSPQ